MVELVVHDGTVVTAAGARPCDVVVADGRIAGLVPHGTEVAGATRVAAAGCWVLPGLVDGHVHFRTPGLEHKEDWPSGSAAAVAGGVTTVLDMPNTVPPTLAAADLVAKERAIQGRSFCHYGFHGGLDPAALPGLLTAGVIGIKVFLGETTASIPAPDDGALLSALGTIAAAGRRTIVHAENGALLAWGARGQAGVPWSLARHRDSRPAVAEVEAVSRVCILAQAAGAPVAIAHVSAAGSVAVIRAAKRAGIDVRAEVCPHHLLLTAEEAEPLGTLGKVNPPLRSAADRAALWEGLADGTIDQIGSDHAPHTPQERAVADGAAAPSGFAGVQNALPLLWGVGCLTPLDLARLLATAPARTWGLAPRKGVIARGSDADLVIVRPGPPQTWPRQWSRNPDSPLTRLCPPRAAIVATLVSGQLAFADGVPLAPPRGTWLRP